jgi:hypothetical protein
MRAPRRSLGGRRGPKPRWKVALTAPEYRELQRLARRRTAPHAEVVRAKILLLAYEHPEWSNAAIARAVGCTDWTVRKWRRRCRAGPTLQDAPRPGGPRFFSLSGPGTGHRVGLHLAAGVR